MTKQAGELTEEQLAVIEDLADGELDETAVLKKHGVSKDNYRQWLEQEAYIAELQFLMDSARRLGMFRIARYAPKAAKSLLALATDKSKPDVARRACLDILTMPQSLADRVDEASDKGTIEPLVDTPTAAIILAALAKAKRKKSSLSSEETVQKPTDTQGR